MTSPEQWLERPPVGLPKVFDEQDYPNHHMARIACRSCGTTWEALYPKQANPEQMECYNCKAKDSEIVRYIKFIHIQ